MLTLPGPGVTPQFPRGFRITRHDCDVPDEHSGRGTGDRAAHKRARNLITPSGTGLPESWSQHHCHQRQYNRPVASSWVKHLVAGRGHIRHHPILARLASTAFDGLLQMMLYSWGQISRVAFERIGPIRDRFRSRLVMAGDTATPLHGYQTNNTRSFLNLSRNMYVLHRSNIRNDV